jgi:hypothetical protein
VQHYTVPAPVALGDLAVFALVLLVVCVVVVVLASLSGVAWGRLFRRGRPGPTMQFNGDTAGEYDYKQQADGSITSVTITPASGNFPPGTPLDVRKDPDT